MTFQPHPPDQPTPGLGRRPALVAPVIGLPLLCWALAQTWSKLAADRTRTSARGDRGDALTYVVLAVGGAAIAAAVLLILKTKSQTIVNQICTNADPTTC
jgi:hypothetical protein